MDKKYIVSGIILAVILSLISKVGEFFVSKVSISIWLLSLLIIFGLLFILILIFKLKSPKHKRYKEDIFDGIRWRWNYDLFNGITEPVPYCLFDDTLLVYSSWNNKTSFECETCKTRQAFFDGDISYNSFPCGLCRRVYVGKCENPRFSYKLVS
jgi:hypothetical protein